LVTKFVYPKLPAKFNLVIFRIGGYGLANSLFVYSKAIILSYKLSAELLPPAWLNFSAGPYIRRENDKRHYFGIFKFKLKWEFRKLIKLFIYRNNTKYVAGISEYFEGLKFNSDLVKSHLTISLSEFSKSNLPALNENVIGIHIRLGDYPASRRTNLDWYMLIISRILSTQFFENYQIRVFSDGSNAELLQLLKFDNLTIVRNDSAFNDIWALSQCKLIIGSDSTFSAWGSYLGQVPIIFPKRHFGSVLDNPDFEIVLGDNYDELIPFLTRIIQKNGIEVCLEKI
jgi:hypothetical protein